jgi:hypothetical protein
MIKGWLYGPVIESDIIRKSTANIHLDNASSGDQVIYLNTGTSNFKIGEMVYEGRTSEAANASGFVKLWDNTSNTLIINDTRGVLQVGKTISGAVSNASWNISGFAVNKYQLVNITVTPDPLSANADTAFGYDTVIEEAPNIT